MNETLKSLRYTLLAVVAALEGRLQVRIPAATHRAPGRTGVVAVLVAVVALYVAVDFLFAAVRTGAGKSLPSGAAAD